eukprot:CAMPEP_0185758208 /NCGR_PEP_ID=MMETSP1174-20130828/16790_1 /TAXON_ID=35687 /ORGANISM="Dictyocha speculum, Strain CCMP1381" /LENGTH=110 /DNA_ID=CAMNT_0028437949 /DNA_START=442 /DNA_END=774 /DNA_ORIENTATION=-
MTLSPSARVMAMPTGPLNTFPSLSMRPPCDSMRQRSSSRAVVESTDNAIESQIHPASLVSPRDGLGRLIPSTPRLSPTFATAAVSSVRSATTAVDPDTRDSTSEFRSSAS